jgi:hypothetical protein
VSLSAWRRHQEAELRRDGPAGGSQLTGDPPGDPDLARSGPSPVLADVVIGWQTRKVAWFMVLYLIVATLIGHRFWDYEAAQRGAQMANFFKNVCMMGGFMLLAHFGPGSASLDKS